MADKVVKALRHKKHMALKTKSLIFYFMMMYVMKSELMKQLHGCKWTGEQWWNADKIKGRIKSSQFKITCQN